jgi:apoptosis-inducing factor 2
MGNTGTARPQIAVIGGGYAGIAVAKGLDDVADVTLVDPSEAFVHNVAALRAVAQPEWLDKMFFRHENLLANGTFLCDRAVAVEGRKVTLESGGELEPDYLVLATGSTYPFPAKSDEPLVDAARAKYRTAQDALEKADRVLIVGAGPVGLELAGEIKHVSPDKGVILVDTAPDILAGPFDQALRDELRSQVEKLGIELRTGTALSALPATEPGTAAPVSVTTASGDTLTADVWFRCFGVTPQTGYLRGALADQVDAAGFVRVDDQLRVAGGENVFALGDASNADRKTAGAAATEAAVLVQNLRAQITGEGETATYAASPPAIVLPLGPTGGASQLPGRGVVDAGMTSQIKGQSLLIDMYRGMFDAEARG